MPRGAKSKRHAAEKRRQARAKAQVNGVQDPAAAEKEATPPSSPSREGASQSEPAPGSRSNSRGRERKPTGSTRSQGRRDAGSGGTSRGRQRPQSAASSSASSSPERSDEGPRSENERMGYSFNFPGPELIAKKATLLEQFMLYKYKVKQPSKKEDMLKVISPEFQDHFAEILRKAAEHIEMVFAMEVKEVDSATVAYDLVSKLKLPNNGRVRPGKGLPKTGLLMNILGMIFIKGNCAKEEDIWKFLSMMRVYAGKKHFIYGEPKKLITKDLVRLKYLEYRQVANSDPPCFEFLWGPKAHAETSKMMVLKFLAKINDSVPTDFESLYEEALKDEKSKE